MNLLDYVRRPTLAARKLRWLWLHVGQPREITIETFNGRLTFSSKDSITGKRLFVQRSHEAQDIVSTVEILRREGHLTAERGTLLDVGANIGMISIAFLRYGYCRRALAFEPAPANFRLLGHNVSQNGFTERVRAFPWALSSDDGEMTLELSDRNWGDHRIRHTSEPGAYREQERDVIRVPVRKLDGALADARVEPREIALIWLDVQGHEGHFFKGARGVLFHGIPVVAEFWPYGIQRSGMTETEYLSIVSELFTHFYVPARSTVDRRPVAAIQDLFDRLRAPNEAEQVLFVRSR